MPGRLGKRPAPMHFSNVLKGNQRRSMNDLIYVGLTLVFLALTYGLIVLCERLMEEKS